LSIFTQALVFERYGARLDLDDLAQLLKVQKTTIYKHRGLGTFPIPTYQEGKLIFADYRDVAEYLDRCRAQAKAAA
jgi:predicted site-specific integrase-resolvase